jgi:predicted NAD-dependent protein-ADP-ribosyltransferase YbiA (DUF1768 family)
MLKFNPKSGFREYVKGESCLKFFSDAKEPVCKLSNFCLIKEGIEVFGIRYATSEHAYQAQKFIAQQRE